MPHFPKPFYREPLGKWYVQIAGKQIPLGPDEKPRRDKLGKPVAPQAVVDRYHELMASREKGDDAPARLTADLAVVVVDRFLDWVQRRKAPRTYEWYLRHLQNFGDRIPRKLAVAQLRPHHVTAIIDSRDDWSPSTKYGFARCVQRAFRWATQEGLIDRSPLAGMAKPEPEGRDVVITDGEYAAMLDAAREPGFRDLIVAAWETGARPRELITVEAKHVQVDQGRWVFPKKQAKGKRQPRAVYLTDAALEITRRLMAENPTGPLFRNSGGEPWHRWSVNCAFIRLRTAIGRKAMAERGIAVEKIPRFSGAGLDPETLESARAEQEANLAARRKEIARLALENAPACSLGSFRHTFGDRALKRGVDPITVANLLGHRNLAMLANTYSHLNQDGGYLREAASRATRNGDASAGGCSPPASPP